MEREMTEGRNVFGLLPDQEAVQPYLLPEQGGGLEADILPSEGSELEQMLKGISHDGETRIVYYEPNVNPVDYEEDGEEEEASIYIVEDEESDFNYLFVPRGVQVHRVSQNVLGPNVLGRTWPGSGQIEILDTLYGDAFQEVLLHEVNHVRYPHLNEREVRDRTRMQLASPIYH